MAKRRPRTWGHRCVALSAALGVLVLVACAVSVFCVPLYQQPPGIVIVWLATPPGAMTAPAAPASVTPAGKVRGRLAAGSLIVANGDLPMPGAANVKVTLGYMQKAGWTWFFDSPRMAWGALTRVDTWKYYFYREHVQIQFFPVGVVLLLPWTVRRWLNAHRPAWACGQCGYDRRGGVGGPCPECGAVSPAQASEAVG